MVPNGPEVYTVEWPTRREPMFWTPAQILCDCEIRDMPAKTSQNQTQPAAPPPFMIGDPNDSRRCGSLDSSVRRPSPGLPSYNVPVVPIIVEPIIVKRHPFNGEGDRHE